MSGQNERGVNETLLDIFRQQQGEFVSGEEISHRIGISRTAVWKHMNKLREAGYEFEAVSRKGYRLIGQPSRLSVTEIMMSSEASTLGTNLKLLQVTTSTQEVARELAEQGALEGTLVLAEEQTRGRGRMGRQWYSPPGRGVWMSLLLRPAFPLSAAPQLTLLIAVAVCRAIRIETGVNAGIKWPNDILASGRKLCGILVESALEEERIRYCIAGIGIDVNLSEEELPDELRPIMTSIKIESGREADRSRLVGAIMTELESLYTLYKAEGFGPIASQWEGLSVTLNRQVMIEQPMGTVRGLASALDDTGALIVTLADGRKHKVISGDVIIEG